MILQYPVFPWCNITLILFFCDTSHTCTLIHIPLLSFCPFDWEQHQTPQFWLAACPPCGNTPEQRGETLKPTLFSLIMHVCPNFDVFTWVGRYGALASLKLELVWILKLWFYKINKASFRSYWMSNYNIKLTLQKVQGAFGLVQEIFDVLEPFHHLSCGTFSKMWFAELLQTNSEQLWVLQADSEASQRGEDSLRTCQSIYFFLRGSVICWLFLCFLVFVNWF